MINFNARRAMFEAAELAERFPDLPDQEVIDHVNYVVGLSSKKQGNIFRRAVIAAYDAKDPERGFSSFQAYTGIDLR